MNIHVMLRAGGIDHFYDGPNCGHCGLVVKQTIGPCRGCGSFRGRPMRIKPGGQIAKLDPHGALIVTNRSGKQIAYYRPGAWVSWRTS